MQNFINGLKFIHGISQRRLKNIVIYTTDRCNSRCRTCFIWKKRPKTDIRVETIENIINDDISNGASLKITGGEFLLHPKYDEILSAVVDSGMDYHIFSNGILAERLIKTVREFKVGELAISCDAVGEKYKEIRGVDNFDNIKRIVNELQHETKILLNYTISPFNSKEDLEQVIEYANSKNVKLVIGVFNTLEYFDVNASKNKAYNLDGISENCLQLSKGLTNRYINLYNRWINGEYDIPCLNIRSQLAVYPNAEVHLCEGKNVVLGNLEKTSLTDIWNNEKTIQLQKQNSKCNACFLTCQRPIDVAIASLPLKWLIK